MTLVHLLWLLQGVGWGLAACGLTQVALAKRGRRKRKSESA